MKKIRTNKTNRQTGFSLIELTIAMTITISILTMAFYLLAESLHRKTGDENRVAAMADANQALSIISKETANAGFGLTSNGLAAADCSEDKIRIRANLNALLGQTTSNTVSDQDEDIEFFLVSNPNGSSALVRNDVGGNLSSIIATNFDNTDINNDGNGDGLTFYYLDANGNAVLPQNAVKVQIIIRIVLPQVGVPESPGFQPQITKQLYSSVVLRNTRLITY